MPVPCDAALDVGCGEGQLSTKMATRSKRVTAIDISPRMVALARESVRADNVTFIEGDVIDHPFTAESFDFIAAVAVLHQMPFGDSLRRLAGLLRRGGVLAVVGLARNGSPADYAVSAISVPVARIFRMRRGMSDSLAPRLDPDMTYREINDMARAALPGVEVRRRLFFRHTLLWRKP
jgi:ubiquinone/menaquinone biosynthesis C-methylase UbiE